METMECGVCIEQLEVGSIVSKCNRCHQFLHTSCALKCQNRCPYCRFEARRPGLAIAALAGEEQTEVEEGRREDSNSRRASSALNGLSAHSDGSRDFPTDAGAAITIQALARGVLLRQKPAYTHPAFIAGQNRMLAKFVVPPTTAAARSRSSLSVTRRGGCFMSRLLCKLSPISLRRPGEANCRPSSDVEAGAPAAPPHSTSTPVQVI